MPGKRRIRIGIWLLMAALWLGLLPGAVRAEGTSTLQKIETPEALTDGSYVLMLSGQAMGAKTEEGQAGAVTPVMEDDRPVWTPDILWTLTVTEDGILLTDPAGNPLMPGDGLWNASCENSCFRFSAAAEGASVTLGFSGGCFFISEPGQEGFLTEFTLFRLTDTDTETDADVLPPSPEATEPPVTGLYFGLLHAHTTFSDGEGTMEEILAESAGEMDFLAVTDHSDSLTEEEWAEGRTAAENAASENFAALRGYEMSWPEGLHLGHISTFGTEGYVSWQEDTYSAYASGLENYYSALAGQGNAFGQFQHPGNFFGNFKNFAYNAEADRVITLLEVACEGETYYSAYTAALDKGWHVAPTFGGNVHEGEIGTGTGRTVVRMDALTPENLRQALKNRRAYATEDADLHILYSLDGYEMGDMVPCRRVGPTAEIDVTLYDPTDEAVGTAEVITPGGAVAASIPVLCNPERITLSLPADQDYYYLRITQPDGDIAVTAPVWVEQTENLGISGLTYSPEVPVQGSPVELALTLFNEETIPLDVTALELLVDGEPVAKWEESFRVEAGTSLEKRLTYTHEKLGEAELTLQVTAMLDGQPRSYGQTLYLSARRQDLVTGILVDGAHANAGIDSFTELTRLAARQNMQVTIARETITEEMLGGCNLLIITSPEADFSGEFLETLREYVAYGGDLMVCADDPARAGELNRLLATVGSSMYYGDELPEHRPREFNREDPLCAGVNENQMFYMKRGCALEPRGGTWVVKGQGILMARETVAGGGTILACGSLLPADPAVQEPAYLWEEAYANRTIVNALLGASQSPLPLSTIREVREGERDEVYRVRGYVTSATFPETLFLQDKTGGIGVIPFRETAIGLGRAVEITGSLSWQEGEPVLTPISVQLLDQSGYRYRPQELNCREAQDGETYGGLLVQVAGICTERTLAEDGTLCRFVLRDSTGRKLPVVIGETIVSSATGKNTLHTVVEKGEEIWAIGILQTDGEGNTFLRVRNCEEVVSVAPNPYTGDGAGLFLAAMLLSGIGLAAIHAGRKQRPFR